MNIDLEAVWEYIEYMRYFLLAIIPVLVGVEMYFLYIKKNLITFDIIGFEYEVNSINTQFENKYDVIGKLEIDRVINDEDIKRIHNFEIKYRFKNNIIGQTIIFADNKHKKDNFFNLPICSIQHKTAEDYPELLKIVIEIKYEKLPNKIKYLCVNIDCAITPYNIEMKMKNRSLIGEKYV